MFGKLAQLLGRTAKNAAARTGSADTNAILNKIRSAGLDSGGTVNRFGDAIPVEGNYFVGGYNRIGHDGLDIADQAAVRQAVEDVADNPRTANVGWWTNPEGKLAIDNTTVTRNPLYPVGQMISPTRIPQESFFVGDLGDSVFMRPGNKYFPMQQPRIGGYGVNPATGTKYPLYEPWRRARDAAGIGAGLGAGGAIAYNLVDGAGEGE